MIQTPRRAFVTVCTCVYCGWGWVEWEACDAPNQVSVTEWSDLTKRIMLTREFFYNTVTGDYILYNSKRGLRDSLHLYQCVCFCLSVCECVYESKPGFQFSQTYALHFSGVFTFFSFCPSIVTASSRWVVLRWSRLLTSLRVHCVHTQWDHCGDSTVPVS